MLQTPKSKVKSQKLDSGAALGGAHSSFTTGDPSHTKQPGRTSDSGQAEVGADCGAVVCCWVQTFCHHVVAPPSEGRHIHWSESAGPSTAAPSPLHLHTTLQVAAILSGALEARSERSRGMMLHQSFAIKLPAERVDGYTLMEMKSEGLYEHCVRDYCAHMLMYEPFRFVASLVVGSLALA